jgi:hypothetical protein
VVTGVIMPFQIGTNWSRYADTAGNVLGPLFAYRTVNGRGLSTSPTTAASMAGSCRSARRTPAQST